VRVMPKIQPTQEFVQPKAIPKQVQIIKEDPVPPPPPQEKVPERVRVGGQVQPPQLVNKTNPAYPPLARQARIQGTVKLEGVIGKDGTVQELKVVSGHPLLIQAALDAVRNWRYRPTMLNGQPVEVITTIDVNFTLGG